MSEVGAGLRWRDALVLFVLGTVIVSGIVHYGRGLGDDGDPATRDVGQGPAPTRSPSAQETARLEGAPPADPAQPPAPGGGTCWDGRATTSLRLCGLPEGARGLEWVFPSFARDRAQCHKAQPDDESYPVIDSYECFQRALRRPVTVTYDEVDDPTQVRAVAAGPARQVEPERAPGPPRRPLHLHRRREPPRADHRDLRAVPLRRLGLRQEPRRPSGRGGRSSGSGPAEIRGVRND